MNQISGKGTFQHHVFGDESRRQFDSCYPEQAGLLDHNMFSHELLTLDALARLGTSLPEKSIEYNPGDLPVGIKPEDVPGNVMTIGDTIRKIDQSASWAVLKNIEQMPEYEALLNSLLSEIRPILKPQGYIFVSSPDAVTPYHFDPEHNILLQLRGEKWMTTFPAGNAHYAADEIHEGYHLGGHRNLVWQDDFEAEGTRHHLTPGKAIFVPVMAPHFCEGRPGTEHLALDHLAQRLEL
ncbi:transcriptional regulator [Parasphingorhabdus sp.]|uniref:transcriptional regulator n=1 Tax=Parasphingorhabdus sp. TaxID=2709688 RepID=UPI0030EC76F7